MSEEMKKVTTPKRFIDAGEELMESRRLNINAITDLEWLQVEKYAKGCKQHKLVDWLTLEDAIKKSNAINKVGQCMTSVRTLCELLVAKRQLATVTAERDEARRERDELRELLKLDKSIGDVFNSKCESEVTLTCEDGESADIVFEWVQELLEESMSLAAALNTEGKQG